VFVSITRTKTDDDAVELATIVGEEMERWLRDMEGFRGFMLVSRPGESLGLAFWESREIAERLEPVRAQFRERMLSIAGVEIEAVDGYEVAYTRLGAGFDGL
jgi:hypothetical protein